MTFDKPVAMPGAVSLALDPNGEPESFYADGIEYYIIANNMGYDGDLELALIPESFRTDVLKEEADGNEVLFKASAAIPRIYRLKFQRDIYKDLRILEKSIGEGDEEHFNLDLFSL